MSFDSVFKVYDSFENVPTPWKERIWETMFCPLPKEEMLSNLHIDWCIWVFPHDQNTSGFFICAFRKWEKTQIVKESDWKVPEETKTPV